MASPQAGAAASKRQPRAAAPAMDTAAVVIGAAETMALPHRGASS